MIKRFFKWLRQVFRRHRLKRAEKQLQAVYVKRVLERQELKGKIIRFLRFYFGVDKKSKYIPPDFKNKEEVRVAVLDKFSAEMERLNLNYDDIFK